MKISLDWLAEYLPGSISAETASEALTHGGLPVELVERHGDDTVIDVEVTSNRGDCLCHVGVARELSALLDRPFKPVAPSAKESPTPAASATSVQITAPQLCPHYTARVIRNVKIGPSPAWMVRRLEAVGLRSINNIVDVTNYVMFEMGQPLHAFDYDKLEEHRIIVREALPGETIVSIDGHKRVLQPGMLVIADARKAVAVAGVMGGLESEVSETTANVLLESARFDALSVRKTSRALTLKSDSSYRFERQIDATLPERASLRAARLILQIAGGELLSGLVSAGQADFKPRNLQLRLQRLNDILGIEIPADAAMAVLSRLQFSPQLKRAVIECTIPSWRLDVNLEIDLIEEVARVLGYDKVPVRDEISIRLVPPQPQAQTIEQIRATLVSAGLFESLTVGFVSDALADDFVPPEAKGLLRADPMVRKDNARLRPSLLPGLLEAIRRNETVGTLGARLFEIGDTFWTDEQGNVDERRRLALAGAEDYRDMRGAVETLLSRLDADRPIRIVPGERPGYAKGACGRVEWGGETIGYIGLTPRNVAEKLSLRELPPIVEIELAPLLKHAQHVPQLHRLPRFPAVRRDLSLVVSEQVPFERIEGLISELKLPDLEEVEYVTTYRGKPLEKGSKSVTVTLAFRSATTTLTSEQVESSVQRAIVAAQEQLGATLRA